MPSKLLTEGLIKDPHNFEQALKSSKSEQIKYFKNAFNKMRSFGLDEEAESSNVDSETGQTKSLQDEILIDWFLMCVEFGIKDLLLDSSQINIFLAIVNDLHEFSCSTCFANQKKAYSYMSELLLAHSVNEAPWKLVIFQPSEIRKLADFIVENYFRHYNLYKYTFTSETQIDLKLQTTHQNEIPNSNENPTTRNNTLKFDILPEETKNLIASCNKLQISTESEKIQRKIQNEIKIIDQSIQEKAKELAPKSGKK